MRKIIKKIAAVALLVSSLVAFSCSFDASMYGDEDEATPRYKENSEIVETK
ncbi:MAG: hypothetical protein II811_01480 [Spirochaetaceae bacterium]|nr:hypothetical protein [Spirochaetaceae bacterium]